MSYVPEILISKHREVLRQIRSPFTNAVCWEITGEEAATLAEHAKICDAFYKGNFRTLKRTIDRPFDAGESALRSFTEKHTPFIEEILAPLVSGPVPPLVSHPITSQFFHVSYNPAETLFGYSSTPHVDDIIKVFFSFNNHMQSTRCIPREYAGEPNNGGGWHFSAERSKAVALPGMSVSIIDLGKQVHMAPIDVPPGRGRILHVKRYNYA